ncbi:MAG: hypothetical protein KDK23_09580 [Leptospiraceae bacterium]|nr:hypothetical protein [Leptospiraceae bacterium]
MPLGFFLLAVDFLVEVGLFFDLAEEALFLAFLPLPDFAVDDFFFFLAAGPELPLEALFLAAFALPRSSMPGRPDGV